MSDASRVATEAGLVDAKIRQFDAFRLRPEDFSDLPADAEILAIGNPPWVTNAAQAAQGNANLPVKSNRFALNGLDALTGKANFDIAEAVMLVLIESVMRFRAVSFAFLLKKSVSVKLASQLFGEPGFSDFRFDRIDAQVSFGASVEAGLLRFRWRRGAAPGDARIRMADTLGGPLMRTSGLRDGERWIEDMGAYGKTEHLEASEGRAFTWRQGIKHDAARVLELRERGGDLVNGFGESVDIERDALSPLYKSSDLANNRSASRLFPLYQHDLSGPLPDLRDRWPRLFAYLQRHTEELGARKSRIYVGKPPFMLFGVGPYTLAPYKVGISGLYKKPEFVVVGPQGGAPPLVDDTCYLLPFATHDEATKVAAYLNSPDVLALLKNIADITAKRPFTKAVLSRIADPNATTEGSPQLQLDATAA